MEKNIVFFIGAGASKPFGGFLCSDIITHVDRLVEDSDNKDIPIVWETLKNISKERCEGYVNYEWLLNTTQNCWKGKEGISIIRPSAIPELERYNRENIKPDEEWIDKNVLGYRETDPLCLEIYEQLRAVTEIPVVLTSLNSSKVSDNAIFCYNALHKSIRMKHIITTNFDTIIEKVFLHLGYKVFEGFDEAGAFNPLLFLVPNESCTNIMHIHGSYHWVCSLDTPKINRKKEDSWYHVIPGANLLIPTVYKDTSAYPFKELLSISKEWLKNCDVCIVIGYSFNDLHIKEIFREVCQGRENELTLIVVDPSANNLVNRLKETMTSVELFPIGLPWSAENISVIVSKIKNTITQRNIEIDKRAKMYRQGLSISDLKEQHNKIINAQFWLKKGLMKEVKFKESQCENQEAIECLDRALTFDPTLEKAWGWKGLALVGLERYEEAIVCFDRALKLNPKMEYSAMMWHYKGAALGELGRPQEALLCYEEALRQGRREAGPLISLCKKEMNIKEI